MKQISLFNAPARILKEESFVDTLRNMVDQYEQDNPFYVMDVGDVLQKIKTWRHKLPRVKMYYAVKCNDHPYVLQILNALGTCFDCASKNEIQQVLSMGVDPSRVIYAHPSKPASHLRAAKAAGVDLMTFDSIAELEKVKDIFPSARLVLRIRCDAAVAQVPLGLKFGVLPEYSHVLLNAARDLDLNVVGVSFHVGSGCQEPQVFLRAIKAAKEVFEEAKEYGFNFHLLDIGGGFPGSTDYTLDELANYVNKGLEDFFPDENEVQVIAEPGRYVVASAFTLVTKVLSKQWSNIVDSGPPFSYYINDGVYGSFNCLLYDGQKVHPNVLRDIEPNEQYYDSVIWGPTCDSFDKIYDHISLPELKPGDWMYWRDMGAYTLVGACTFNGFPIPDVCMVLPLHSWFHLKNILSDDDMIEATEVDLIELGSLADADPSALKKLNGPIFRDNNFESVVTNIGRGHLVSDLL